MVPQATVKVAVVDESADNAPTALAATVTAERSPSSRPDAGEARSEWMAGLAVSAARWFVRLSALLVGLAKETLDVRSETIACDVLAERVGGDGEPGRDLESLA